jgi:hypothetical protein
MIAMKILLLSAALLPAAVTGAFAQSGTSAFTTRLDDPRAVELSGADGRTLFILTHHALFAVRT